MDQTITVDTLYTDTLLEGYAHMLN